MTARSAPPPGLALIVGGEPERAILTDGARHWRFPRPPDLRVAAFRPGESLMEWAVRLWPEGLGPRELQRLAEPAAEGAFSTTPSSGARELPAALDFPLEPERRGGWRLWRVAARAYLAPADDAQAAEVLADRLAHRLSIRTALAGPHRLIWLTAPPPLPALPPGSPALMTAEHGRWRAMEAAHLWTAEGLADPAFGLMHTPRLQRTARGWLAEAQLYPPPGTLRPGRWPPRAGCCGLAADPPSAWRKAAHEAAERCLVAGLPGGERRASGSAVHTDSRAARRIAGWEAVEREALAQFWTSPGRPVWHPVPGEGGQLLWTRLPAMAGEAVLLTRRDGSVIGTAAAPAERIALSSALEEFTAMASGGARLRPADAQRLRALIGRGRRKAASTRECRPSPLPRHLRTRVATPVGLPISLAVCRSLPEARLRLPQWDV